MAATVQIEFDDGSRAMERGVEADLGTAERHRGDVPADDYYEVAATAAVIERRQPSRVALQFPDALLSDAPFVCNALQGRAGDGVLVFVLGDTTFAPCCVDEIAAEHLNADLVVHYGDTCMSPTSRVPVYYVFGRAPLDEGAVADRAASALVEQGARPALLVFNAVLDHAAPRVAAALRSRGHTVWTARPRREQEPAQTPTQGGLAASNGTGNGEGDSAKLLGRRVCAEDSAAVEGWREQEPVVLYIGEEGAELTSLAFEAHGLPVMCLDPSTLAVVPLSRRVHRALMRRFYIVERCKDASVFGIVAGTLGVARYQAAIARVKALVENAGRKAYVFAVGKLNVAKLANFSEVEVFVHVACPRSALVEDANEYHAPLATPMDVELALGQGEGWTGQYSTDFAAILPAADAEGGSGAQAGAGAGEAEAEGGDEDDFTVEFSAVTGRMMQRPKHGRARKPAAGAGEGAAEGAMVALEGERAIMAFESPAAAALQKREYQGLEARVGDTEVHAAKPGMRGTAAGYQPLAGSETAPAAEAAALASGRGGERGGEAE